MDFVIQQSLWGFFTDAVAGVESDLCQLIGTLNPVWFNARRAPTYTCTCTADGMVRVLQFGVCDLAFA